MSTNESHKIDELFRDELSDYTVPVTLTAVPLLAIAAKKGLFYKVAALLKVNTITLIAGTATVTSVATIATVKIVEHYQKKNDVVVQQKQVEQNEKTNANTQQQFIDTLKQQTSNATEIVPVVEVKAQKVEAKNPAIKTEASIVPKKNEKENASQTTTNSAVQQTQTANPISISQTEKVIQTATDSTQKAVAPVRKVVYVKQKPVVVQDSVVKVIKKVRPKKE